MRFDHTTATSSCCCVRRAGWTRPREARATKPPKAIAMSRWSPVRTPTASPTAAARRSPPSAASTRSACWQGPLREGGRRLPAQRQGKVPDPSAERLRGGRRRRAKPQRRLANSIVLQAAQKIPLKVGNSTVVVNAGGTWLDGPIVPLQQGGAADSAASVTIKDIADAAKADPGDPRQPASGLARRQRWTAGPAHRAAAGRRARAFWWRRPLFRLRCAGR